MIETIVTVGYKTKYNQSGNAKTNYLETVALPTFFISGVRKTKIEAQISRKSIFLKITFPHF